MVVSHRACHAALLQGQGLNENLRDRFLADLRERFGSVVKLDGSQSLYDVGANVRVYLRYSRVHAGQRTFYGLRRDDLRRLAGRHSYICFLWEGQDAPLLVPFSVYEDVFDETTPARDGQYKTQVMIGEGGTDLYIARAGRFNVDGHRGWTAIERSAAKDTSENVILSHQQIQTLLGAIATLKTFDVWIPPNDRPGLDWALASRFRCLGRLPYEQRICNLLQEIDVVWMRRGSNEIVALYEVEHSTPIYSGLLRLNDIHLTLTTVPTLAHVSLFDW